MVSCKHRGSPEDCTRGGHDDDLAPVLVPRREMKHDLKGNAKGPKRDLKNDSKGDLGKDPISPKKDLPDASKRKADMVYR
jgi:hypothetical protein